MVVILIILSGLGFLAFYLSRSSKEMPKNWSQLRSEILWQYLGVRGLIEDYVLRKYNRVGECLIKINEYFDSVHFIQSQICSIRRDV